MILTVFLAVCIYNMKLSPLKSFNDRYLSRETTTAIKGIFVFFVFLSHFSQYFPYGADPGSAYYLIKHNSGQLIVTMFLFYSGYGIFESVKRKGTDYIKTFPKNRILKTMFHFDCAILLYYIINLILGLKFSLTDYLLSLFGWTSIGNSNWFIFAILVQYVIVYISFIVFRKNNLPAIVAITILTVAYMFVMSKFKDAYWYNTALCLPLGLWYSYLKDFIEKISMKHNILYFLFLFLSVAAYYVSFTHSKNILFYEIWMLSFIAIVILITMKVNICNKALIWLGNHVFSIYILQRMPMLIFKKTNVKFNNINLYFILCFGITIILAQLFDMTMGTADKKLFKAK